MDKQLGVMISKTTLALPSQLGPELVKKFEEHLERFNDIVELRLTTSGVSSIKKSDHVFTLTSGSGQTDRARAIIIACGRRPRQLGLIGEKEFLNRGVTYCAWCDGRFLPARMWPLSVVAIQR